MFCYKIIRCISQFSSLRLRLLKFREGSVSKKRGGLLAGGRSHFGDQHVGTSGRGGTQAAGTEQAFAADLRRGKMSK